MGNILPNLGYSRLSGPSQKYLGREVLWIFVTPKYLHTHSEITWGLDLCLNMKCICFMHIFYTRPDVILYTCLGLNCDLSHKIKC